MFKARLRLCPACGELVRRICPTCFFCEPCINSSRARTLDHYYNCPLENTVTCDSVPHYRSVYADVIRRSDQLAKEDRLFSSENTFVENA